MTAHYRGRVAPFGDLRIKACLAAPRSLSQLATSFFAYSRQGIHRVPLVACPSLRPGVPEPPGCPDAIAWVSYHALALSDGLPVQLVKDRLAGAGNLLR